MADFNNNQVITYYLKKLYSERRQKGDTYNARIYDRAASAISNHKLPIKTISDVNPIKGVGISVASRIEYVLDNLENIKKEMVQNDGKNVVNDNAISKRDRELLKKGNINQVIVNYLRKLSQTYREANDVYRSRAYSRAAIVIEKHPHQIKSGKDAQKIKGIGRGIGGKIDEIINTGKLSIVDENEVTELGKSQVIQQFLKIFGAGPVTAKKWYDMEYRTLDDLATKATLTKQHQIGLLYYDDLQLKIPRYEVTEIGDKVKTLVSSISNNLYIEICGSYRRGVKMLGDIDILITRRQLRSPKGYMKDIIKVLKEERLLVADLSMGDDKYMGICRIELKSPARRIDIRMIPRESWICALLYFTGSAELNKKMRLRAMELGFKLSEHGLFELRTSISRKINSEKMVFDILGMKYLDPTARNIT